MVWQRAVLILFSTANALLHLSQSVMKISKKVIGLDQGSSQFTMSNFWGGHVKVAFFMRSSAIEMNLAFCENHVVQLSPMCFPKLVPWWCADLVSQISFVMNIWTFQKLSRERCRAELVSLPSGPSFVAGIICSINFFDACLQGRHTPGLQRGVWVQETAIENWTLYMILGILLFKKYIHSTIVDNIIVDHMNIYNICSTHMVEVSIFFNQSGCIAAVSWE